MSRPGSRWCCAIEEEEKFLSQDQAYRDYKADVRWRLLPGFY